MKRIKVTPTWCFSDDDGHRLDTNLLRLLGAVHRHGKLTHAAEEAGISYRHAWNLLRQGGEFFCVSLVELERGRGARLSPLGEKLLWAEQRATARLSPQLDSLGSELNLAIQQHQEGIQPVLRLHASHGFAIELLPQHLGELGEMRCAYNMTHSQSGFAAPVRLLASSGHASLPEPLETGAHRASIIAVATGEADWAAIDAVAWELARRHEPAAEDLVVFATTPETPALPLITSAAYAGRAEAIADAVDAAIRELDQDVRDALFITGLMRFKPQDYAPLAAPLPVRHAFPHLG